MSINLNVLCMRVVILVSLTSLILVYRMSVNVQESGSTSELIKVSPGIIYMLQWTSPTTEPFSFMEQGEQTFVDRGCLVMNCYVTSNRKILGDITNFDAILFHGREIILQQYAFDMPLKRISNQFYVFGSMESSGYYPVYSNKFDGFFNTTWTYKLDSDVYFGYIAIRDKQGKVIGPSENMNWLSNDKMLPITENIRKKIANKRIAAAWFVSNCKAPSQRDNFVKEIQLEMLQYDLSVDVYGKCGDKQCPRSSANECLKLIENDYYFYFAFENSFAEDYVTEKLLSGLNSYAVPVVFGGANYTRFMPDGAYLDALKLGPQELVKRMYEIINDPDKYNEFFRWHNHYSYHNVLDSPDTDPFCKLCEYINQMKSKNRYTVIDDFEDWWNPLVEKWIHNYTAPTMK